MVDSIARDATAHIDRYVLEGLPLPQDLPEFLLDAQLYSYPHRLNAAHELIDRVVDEGDGEKLAIVNDAGQWSYRDLRDLSDKIAGLLQDEGLIPGNRVLLRGPNTATLIAAWLGVLKAGGVVVTTIPLLRAADLTPIIARARPDFAIIDDRTIADMGGLACLSDCRCLSFNGDTGLGALEEQLRNQSPIKEVIDTHRDDPAILAFTSGTTGIPKATVHYHRDLLIAADGFSAHCLQPTPEDRFCSSAPIGFTFGLGALLLFPFRARATSVTLEAGTPAALLEAIQRFGVTQLLTAPTAYRAMLKDVANAELSKLRRCVSAGEHLPKSTQEAWQAATGLGIIDGIGATEMMHIFIASDPMTTPAGSSGRPVAGYEACVLDDSGKPCQSGMGRLAVRGPTGCRYFDDSRQKKYVIDGWNVTGDIYRIDDNGDYWFVSRSDSMIVSSGYNIAGPEVEAALLSHPAVAECAVVGLPDHERGCVVAAFIVPNSEFSPSEILKKELQDHVKSVIAPYKYPRQVRFLDSLPKTATGKIRHHELR